MNLLCGESVKRFLNDQFERARELARFARLRMPKLPDRYELVRAMQDMQDRFARLTDVTDEEVRRAIFAIPFHFASSLQNNWTITTQIQGTYQNSVTGQAAVEAWPVNSGGGFTLTNGTPGANLANQFYFLQSVLAASGNTTITFSSGINDAFGNALTFARIKALLIEHLTATTASSISIGNATHPVAIIASTGTSQINNGGRVMYFDPGATAYPTATGSTDQLKILNNDGANQATVNTTAVGSTT